MNNELKRKKMFLSHAFLDRDIASRIIEKLLVPIFLIDKQTEIFYTSKRETGIESSINWRNRIKSNLIECDIFIVLITSNFKKSEMCLGEIGAAWILDKKIYPLILPPIKYESFSPLIAELQADMLLNKDDIKSFINSIRGHLISIYGVDVRINVDIEKCIDDFLRSTKSYLRKHPSLFQPASSIENQQQERKVIKEMTEILASADVSIEKDEKELIKMRSKQEWPNDYSMQEHYIEEQLRALETVKKLQNDVRSDNNLRDIVERAIKDWPNDFSMQVHRAIEEIKAYERLR